MEGSMIKGGRGEEEQRVHTAETKKKRLSVK